MTAPTAPTGPPASEAAAPPPAAPAVPPAPPADKGFPESTPLEQMNTEQREAYWRHYARKHEDTVKAFNGLTPQQVKDLQAKNEELEAKTQTADEKALATAKKEAATAASEAAKAEYLPQIQRLEVKSIAGSVISGDKLNAFMDIVNPAALVGADGTVDETKVMGYLTAMYGDATPPAGQRWQNAGQYSPPPPRGNPGDSGKAEAARRYGTPSK